LSERKIEGFIFGRRLRNDVDEREGAGIINKEGHRASRKLAAE